MSISATIAYTNRQADYGLLYNYYAITDIRGIAPSGYHVATASDFDTLISYLGGTSVAGGKMKEAGITHWTTPNTGATNESNFTALPNGARYSTGTFTGKYTTGIYLTTTDASFFSPYRYTISYNSASINKGSNSPNPINFSRFAYSIRCVRDTAVGWIAGEIVTDYDNNVYETIQIDTQIWLKQNLVTTHYNNGDVINEVTDNGAWSALTTAALCAYNNDWSNVYKYI